MAKMTRRDFLQSATEAADPAYDIEKDVVFKSLANQHLPSFQRTYYTLNQYNGPWGEEQYIHLLRRTMFGVKKTDVATVQNMTMSQAVDYLLDNAPPALSPPVNNYTVLNNTSTIDTTPVLPGQTWVNAAKGNGTINSLRENSLRSWWVSKIVTQNLSIHEKMVMFWHHLIPTSIEVVNDARFSYKYNALLRQYATGNYKSLVRAVTTDPAMLMYLNGHYNTSTAPDENYARELQELFTVGKGPDAHYLESDVQTAAKVLTGWKADATNISATFNSAQHSTINKTFSSFYNNTVITGQTGANGALETDQLINMIFQQPEVAKYICRRLYRFFVYYVIDQDVETNVIAPLSQILINNNFEIKPVLRALLKSEHFWDTDSIGCFIKTPIDLVLGMLRQFNVINFPAATLTTPGGYSVANQYSVWLYLFNRIKEMGLELGNPPNVSGWPPFYQTPEFYELWINSATLPKRASFISQMMQTGFTIGSVNFKIDPIAFTQQFSTPENPDALVDQFIRYLLGIRVIQTKRDYLKSILLTGQINNNYWTSAWNNYMADTTSTTNAGIVRSRLTNLLLEMLRLAEHHLS